ncbi:MAG: hypothetical protein AAFY64_00015 [Pseudomonadota bacterium]
MRRRTTSWSVAVYLRACAIAGIALMLAACAGSDRPYYHDDFGEFETSRGSLKDTPPKPRRARPTPVRKASAKRRTIKSQRKVGRRVQSINNRPNDAAGRAPAPYAPSSTATRGQREAQADPSLTDASPSAPTASLERDDRVPRITPTRPTDTGPDTGNRTVPEPSSRTPRFSNTLGANDDVRCPPSNTACVDGLRALLDDAARAWIDKPARASDYLSGARLVAYGQIRGDLNCRQLLRGIQEARTGEIALGAAIKDEQDRGGEAERLQPVQRIASDVRTKLETARADRC